jgi:hypothetical protein
MNIIEQFEELKKTINLEMSKLSPEQRAKCQDEADKLTKQLSEGQQELLKEIQKWQSK